MVTLSPLQISSQEYLSLLFAAKRAWDVWKAQILTRLKRSPREQAMLGLLVMILSRTQMLPSPVSYGQLHQ